MRRLPLFVWLAGTCFVSLAQAQNRETSKSNVSFPRGTTLVPDLVYCRPDANTRLQLDLARPQGKGPFPVVIFLHGGGWVSGTRKTYLPYMAEAVQAGYIAVSVSYRLAPAHPFPAAIHDVKCAVRWLRTHAVRHEIDPQRIGVVGYSAGGNLAALLGTTHGNTALEGTGGCNDQSSRVQAVVCYYGLSDLRALHGVCERGELSWLERNRMLFALHSYLGGAPATHGKLYAQASPVTHANRESAPMLLVHGTRDTLVPLEQSKLFEAKLKQVGVDVSLLEVRGAGHNFIGAFEKEAAGATIRFLDRHLKKKEDPASRALTSRESRLE